MSGKFSRFVIPAVACAVLMMAAIASATVTEEVLYSFDSNNSTGPRDKLLYSSGTLYGTIPDGGPKSNACTLGCGSIFAFVPKTGGESSYRVIYNFLGGRNDGSSPIGNMVMDSAGNLYGVTSFGGGCGGSGCGTVFKLTPSAGGQWTESIAHSFSEAEGSNPQAGLAMDSFGNLYGTIGGGANGYGSVYELTPNADGSWNELEIYHFRGLADGEYPRAEVTLDSAGNVYGTTSGDNSQNGSVFELTPSSGGEWTEHTLYDFVTATGCNPMAPVWLDSAGNLYGTAEGCGHYAEGVVYKLTRNSDWSWTESTIHAFGETGDGQNPQSGLTPDSQGNLYGTALRGGANGGGTVYRLRPNSNGTLSETVIYSFSSTVGDPTSVFSGVTFGGGTTMYGTSSGGGTLGNGAIYQIAQ